MCICVTQHGCIIVLIIVHILERFMQNLFNVLLVSVLPLPGMMLADAATSVP